MIALLRFYLASGVRVALAAAVPMAGIAVVGIGVQENPAGSVERIAASIAGSTPSMAAISLQAAFALGFALWAAPRVTLGSQGWIRHLPLSQAQHLWALIVATACAEAPLVVAALGLAILASFTSGTIAWAGFFVPPALALSTAAIAIGLRPARRRGRARRWTPLRAPLEVRIAVRAVGPRVISAWLAGALPIGITVLFLSNNVLPPQLARGAVRLGGTLGTALVMAGLADALAIRRPSWPWARSLPSAARRRVAGDAAMLGVSCGPILVVTAGLDVRASVAVAAVMPLLALRAAAAMRRGGELRTAASGPVLIEGAFASGLLALLPWLAFAALAAVPFAFHAAIERERALKVTRWSALHHVAAGDTLSWTA